MGLNESLKKSDKKVYPNGMMAYAPKPSRNWAMVRDKMLLFRPP